MFNNNVVQARRQHLETITHRHGIAGGFRTMAPAVLDQVPDWLRKLRSKISSAESGVQWTAVMQGNGVLPPLHIDTIVPYTMVFDVAQASECTVDVPGPAGMDIHLYVPEDVCKKLAKGVFSTILELVHYDQRHYYHGIRNDLGWALIKQIRGLQNGEGTKINFLEAQRRTLRCTELKDYPKFKASTSQLRLDWQEAVLNNDINHDDAWSARNIKNFLAENLADVFQGNMDRWNLDPANKDKTVPEALEYATSLYTAQYRIQDRKRKATESHSSFVAGAHDQSEYGAQPTYTYPRAQNTFHSDRGGRGSAVRGGGGRGYRGRGAPRRFNGGRGYSDPKRAARGQQWSPQQQRQQPQSSARSYYVEIEEDGSQHWEPEDEKMQEQPEEEAAADNSFLARVDEQAASGCLEGVDRDTFGQGTQ
jgi:hypothetical protein